MENKELSQRGNERLSLVSTCRINKILTYVLLVTGVLLDCRKSLECICGSNNL